MERLITPVPLAQVGATRPPAEPGEGEPASVPLTDFDPTRKFHPDIYWYLSFRCNLACKHCSVFSSPDVDTTGDLTTPQALAVVRQMAELKVRRCLLTGGEALLRPDALVLIQALASHGIGVALETNGLRMTPPFASLARELQAKRLLSITVSLDGGTAATHELLRGKDTFERTVRGLRFLAGQGVRFAVQAVLNGANHHTIPDLYELAGGLWPQMHSLFFAFLNPVGRGSELVREIGLRFSDYPAIFESIHRHLDTWEGRTVIKSPPALVPPRYLATVFKSARVNASVSCQFPLLGVLPNGDVTICAVSRDNQSLFFGNVNDLTLKEVWEKTRMDLLRSRYVAARHLTGICGDCIWHASCRGSCRAWAYEDGGSFDSAFPICRAMDEAGQFPEAYRISAQNKAIQQQVAEHGAGGCACHL